MADLRCPLCTKSLEVRHHGEIELDRCKGCGAIYFDAGELAGALDIALSDEKGIVLAPTAEGSVGLPCPRDGKLMREVQVRTPDGRDIEGATALVHVCGSCKGLLMSRKAMQIAQKQGIEGGDTPSGPPNDDRWFHSAVEVAEFILHFGWLVA